MKTLTKAQVFQHMADNVKAGKSPVDGLEAKSEVIEWTDVPKYVCVSEIVEDYFEFRLAPRTHTINGYEVPAPEIEEPAVGVVYWNLDPFDLDGVYFHRWAGRDVDQKSLRNGLWLSKEDAIANAKALRGENPYE